MKKIIALILMLAAIATLAGCSLLPEELQDSINGFLGADTDPPEGESQEHVHDFLVVESKKVTCTDDGYEKLECSCGETKEESFTALGHDMQDNGGMPASCSRNGIEYRKCSRCSKTESKLIKAYGHEFGDPAEPSRFAFCTREGCTISQPAFGTNGKYTEQLVFDFGEEDKNALAAKHDEILELLNAADAYDPQLHAYCETGELADAYDAVYTVYEEYSDLIFLAQDQYSIVMTLYYCNYATKKYEQEYNDMADYYTDLVSKYYSLSKPWHDSMYRDFFFYGATEEEINAFLFESSAYADKEYAELQERNTAIELEFHNIEDPTKSDLVPQLYAELVANNNRIAEILGYDNYLEYAYENIYDRDYTYQEVAAFTEYVKEYIAPIYSDLNAEYSILMSNGANYTAAEIDDFYSVALYSFFENAQSNELFNDYIDMMEMAFTSNPDKQISFSDELNNLASDGNLFRGSYPGAYVTSLNGSGIPLAYFGQDGYDSPLTVAHEFGHYMNEIYNESEYVQSYDLLETHSQGQEILFVYFIEDYLSATGYKLAKTYNLVSTFGSVISGLRIDCFEQAIYLNSYDGKRADIIMADGKITADEYDLLYASIGEDFGLVDGADDLKYWRHGMTITSPCYYVSYSVSAINAIQIYMIANNESFDAAKECYLKLFTYTDTLESTDDYMTTEEVLQYAGMLSFNDEELYQSIALLFEEQ